MRIAFRLAFAAGLLLLTALPQLRAQAKFDDGKGAFKTGEYRNVLAEAGYKPEEIHARIDKAYQQLFHGNPKTESIAFQAGSNANGPLMFVTDWANNDVRTEGMSYAMMIAVQLGKKSDFDAIWNWATTYMYVPDPKAPSYEYFAWSCKTDGTHNSEGAAPDGERGRQIRTEHFASVATFCETLPRKKRPTAERLCEPMNMTFAETSAARCTIARAAEPIAPAASTFHAGKSVRTRAAPRSARVIARVIASASSAGVEVVTGNASSEGDSAVGGEIGTGHESVTDAT